MNKQTELVISAHDSLNGLREQLQTLDRLVDKTKLTGDVSADMSQIQRSMQTEISNLDRSLQTLKHMNAGNTMMPLFNMICK
ncbi:hypothetical protein [Secundilactobacillus silagei]|uniref:Uncharacterized protein n=1 Tax=Secundilactobacillus silagei JCM 19001 TaxID=1302250 RepID=A0A1Z5IGW4_9LACO|nr:hypothetical protein [Secundilactobacillus silagei]TDG69287.1 hypothetical protein C5L25_000218 [Secundilactobacillus silagei JCM 19001]GAX01010.1 hypothetical protein IWT126_01033 [Secundilactobacillus silagei JCM 19001]